MKIAIFHNFLDNIGGAEIVCLTLARELKADIYTTNINWGKIKKMGFEDIRITSIGNVPTNPPFRQQLALRKFKKLNLGNRYDFYIIGGDWAVSASKNNKPNLWYVHSPIREIWDLYEYTRKHTVPWHKKWIFDLWVKYNRYLNKRYTPEIGKFICNSKNTKKRIKKYLGKNAKVINPPIETSKCYHKSNNNYWLSVNRLITHKRVELQMKAFSKLPDENLIIVGSYENAKHFQDYANYIKKIKPCNVKILSWVNDKKLKELYAHCKGFITTSKNEDFGMAPLEAMASGKPVIAPKEGGYKETVINTKTGILIKNPIDEGKLVIAIKKLNKKLKSNPSKFIKACQNQSKKFDTKIFIKKIKEEIKYG